MADVKEMTEIERLFVCQDINKRTKLNATTEEQLRQVEQIEEHIKNKMNELYIPCES